MNRKKYVKITSIVFAAGFFIYGFLSIMTKRTMNILLPDFLFFAISGMLGGWLIGGIASGILMFASYIKKRKFSFKLLCAIFFPLTYICIFYIGMLGGIPYYIYNIIELRKERKRLPLPEKQNEQIVATHELASKYSKEKEQVGLGGSIIFGILILLFIIVFWEQQRYILFFLMTVTSFSVYYFLCGYLNFVSYKKISNKLIEECDSIQYGEIMKVLLANRQPKILKAKYSLQLLLAQILSGEESDNMKISEQKNEYKIYNNMYLMAKICCLLKQDGKYNELEGLLETVTGINKVLLRIAVLNKYDRYIEAKDLIAELMNKANLRLSKIQMVYLHYFKMQICFAEGDYEQAEYEKKYVLQNGNTLGIVQTIKGLSVVTLKQ